LTSNIYRALALILGLGVGLLHVECAGPSCYRCMAVNGHMQRYCGPSPPEGEALSEIDYRKIPTDDCDTGLCFTTTDTQYGTGMGCLSGHELECVRKHFPKGDCYELNNENQDKLDKCNREMAEKQQIYGGIVSPNRQISGSWGKTCTCNSDFCNRQNLNTVKIMKCISNAENPYEVDCPQGYCITHFNKEGRVTYRDCVETELWGKCAMEVGAGGCYTEQKAVSKLCWDKYSFDPYQDLVDNAKEQKVQSKGTAVTSNSKNHHKTCVCKTELCNNADLPAGYKPGRGRDGKPKGNDANWRASLLFSRRDIHAGFLVSLACFTGVLGRMTY